MADFASMLKYLREREHLSQRELAIKLGMSPSAIGMYESGKRMPRPEDEENIADFFNVDLNILRGRRVYDTEDAKAKEFTDLFLSAPADVQERVVNYLKASKQILDLPHLH